MSFFYYSATITTIYQGISKFLHGIVYSNLLRGNYKIFNHINLYKSKQANQQTKSHRFKFLKKYVLRYPSYFNMTVDLGKKKSLVERRLAQMSFKSPYVCFSVWTDLSHQLCCGQLEFTLYKHRTGYTVAELIYLDHLKDFPKENC